RERRRHAVQNADAVEDAAERSRVLFQPVGAVHVQTYVDAVGLQGVEDRSQHGDRFHRVVNDVERRDHVESPGELDGRIVNLVAYAVDYARLAGLSRRALHTRRGRWRPIAAPTRSIRMFPRACTMRTGRW